MKQSRMKCYSYIPMTNRPCPPFDKPLVSTVPISVHRRSSAASISTTACNRATSVRRRFAPRRGAALYVVILSVTLIVSVLGLAALGELHLRRVASQLDEDMLIARRYAQAAVEIGMLRIAEDANWRSSYTSGVWESDRPLGDGHYTLWGVDPNDGVLAGEPSDPVVLTGIGTRGAATQKVEVTLVPQPRALTALETALHSGGDLQVHQPATVSGSVTISANGTISAVGSVTIYPDCEAAGGYSGTIGPGATAADVAPRELPDPAEVFASYQANGTEISVGSLPSVGGVRTIEQVLLSPASNPYGAGLTNPQGIYVIDCLGQDVRIRDCRIVGTLVLLNAGSGSQLANSLNWSPAVGNYPALLVDGPMALDFTDAPLAETVTNFNPPGTPYEGVENTDLNDDYPSVVKGLVYISGAATSDNRPVIDGAVVLGGTLQIFGDLDLAYQSTYRDNPPPGFVVYDKMKASTGSWRQRVD